MTRQCLGYCKSEYKNKEDASLEIQNMPSSTNRKEGSTDRDTDLQNLIKAQQPFKPIKLLRFQI